MKRKDEPQGILPIEVIEDVSGTDITSYSGLLLTAEAMEALHVRNHARSI